MVLGKAVAKVRLAESWKGRSLNVASVSFFVPLPTMVQTNCCWVWVLGAAMLKNSSKDVKIVRSAKHINLGSMLHNPVVLPWRQRIWVDGLIQAMKHAWMVGRTVEKSQSLENVWMAIFCCWSSGLWAGLAQLKPPPRYWTATLVAPFNPAVFLSTQPSTLHRSQTHISQRKSFHDTWLSTIQATLLVESLNMEEIPPLPRTV